MVLGENIARNAALRENVFMMAVCVDLRIPLFLVGKPGSSKSLAKSIVADSMRGPSSQTELLKSFKQVHMFSYQCSQLSTSQSIIEVFNTAKRFQKDQDTTKYVSVVVLDEVGLAEDSPNLPLKALHPLLEDGTEGSEDRDEVIAREKRVAFIGISNWALDPAKMNRGVMVTRGDPDIDELVLSAQGICHDDESSEVEDRLGKYFQVLAEAYHKICERQTRQFFGLRDFYSLIKMLYWMCEKTNMPLTGPQLVHAIKRNFGGLEESGVDPEKIFFKRLPINIEEAPDPTNIDPAIWEFVSPDNTQRGLIKTSLKTKETSWHGENRYLLFLTENYAALEILQQYLQDQESGHPSLNVHPEQPSLKPWEMAPFVLFGSSFPKDKEYTQVCRNINQIKICMEIGRTVILLNLENLYESLYDVLNQYYIHHGDNRYVDLGLQTHKVKCRVHDEFKLILIAEKNTVYKEFPTPLINRLEKHFVLYSSVLEDWQTGILREMKQWITHFSHMQSSNSTFKESDSFVGYRKDVAAAVVFQASSQLRKTCEILIGQQQLWETAWRDGLLGDCSLEQLAEEDEGSHNWKEAVFLIGQFLLLQTSPPAALVRLGKSRLKDDIERLNRIYRTQHHHSIEEFLTYHLTHDSLRGGLLLQVTTHSHLLSSDEVDELSDSLELSGSPDVFSFLLQEFDTELDFTSKVSSLFVRDEDFHTSSVLIIQCDSGHINGDLIACARYRIDDIRTKALLRRSKHVTHVVFIIHLPVRVAHSTFVGFQGDPWVSCHIDELRPSKKNAITLEVAQGVTVSQLFYGGLEYTGPERQTSEVSSNMESIVFNRLSSAEEGSEEAMEDEHKMLQGIQEMNVEVEHYLEDSNTQSTDRAEGPIETQEESSIQSDSPLGLQKASSVNLTSSGVNKQCIRLNSCIQAAASRLQDSTRDKQRAAERVRLLIKVIPHDPIFPLEPGTFYTILVCHIHRILREREEVYQDDDWVLKEAMDMHNLQTGGTFMNVLTRKLDDIIIPCLAEIIAFVDRSFNLSLLQPHYSPPFSQFWLRIFANKRVEEALRFTDLVGREKVEINHENFACKFPFFWLVKELVDSHWDSAQSTGGTHKQQVHRQLCLLVSDSSLGDVLLSIQDGGQCEELYQCYLHDFVYSVHKCTHQNVDVEYQLIQDSLHCLVVKSQDFSTIDANISLIDRIAAVHVVYQTNCESIHWFGQLTFHSPGILEGLAESIKQTTGYEDEVSMLHLYAVENTLSFLEPPIKADRESQFSDEQSLRPWFNNLKELSNTIESALSLPSQHPIALKARLHWQKIKAIHMFTEHVILNHSNMIVYARRLDLALGSESSNFLMCSTIEKVKRILNNMVRKLKSEMMAKEQKKPLLGIKKSCTNFFIEVVSSLCFGQSSAPEDALVMVLLDIVFTEQKEVEEGGEGEGGKRGTRNLTPFKDDVKDKLPVVRSFLLQLLLEHNTEKVKCHLKTYFDRCQEALVGGMGVDQDLSLLCTQCFENSIDKECCGLSLESKADAILKRNLLTSATDTLVQSAGFTDHTITLEVLESVATMRYCLRVVAEVLLLRVSDQGHSLNVYGHLIHQLLEGTRNACTESKINSTDTTGKLNATGPILFLLKLLVYQGGFSSLTKILKDPQLKWIIPKQLEHDQEKKTLDPFVMYNPAYATIREDMSVAAYGRDYEELEQDIADLQPQECVPLLLSIYQVYTMSRASTSTAKQLLPETITKVDYMILNCNALSQDMKVMARKLVCNDQGGSLAALQVTVSQKTAQQSLGALVVHVVATLTSRSNLDPLCPMVTLLKAPGTLAVS
ncbi:E3 ubiquitin-protein ligase RNF213 [Geodia barretti]|nr:E3 ubiquitin-protein ligase RNF213 [Geodia barretti]